MEFDTDYRLDIVKLFDHLHRAQFDLLLMIPARATTALKTKVYTLSPSLSVSATMQGACHGYVFEQ